MEEDISSIAVPQTKRSKRLKCCNSILHKIPRITRKQFKIYFALFMPMFGSSFSITMLFAFLPFMVQFLLPDIDPSSIGKYAGMIASAMFLGRFVGSYSWGALSDSLGYKPVLIVSSVLVGIVTILFGLSVNFAMAIAMRFTLGLVNGIVGNAKAAMSENCNDQNQAFGMSILAAAFGIGLVVGPAVSGAIADPIGQYNLNITNDGIRYLLTNYPYSLPCFVNGLLCFVAAISVFFLLPGKTKRVAKSSIVTVSESVSNEEESTIIDEISINNSDNTPLLESDEQVVYGIDDEQVSNSIDDGKDESLLKQGSNVTESSVNSKRKLSFILTVIPGRRESATLQYVKIPRSLRATTSGRVVPLVNSSDDNEQVEETGNNTDDLLPTEKDSALCSRNWWKKKLKNLKASTIKSLKDLKSFLSDPVTRMAILSYCIVSFGIIGFDEIYSVWCATPAYLGGLDFSLNQVGLSLSIVGVILIPFSFIVFPAMERQLGTVKTLTILLSVLIFLVVLLPNLHYLVPLDQSIVLWISLCTVMVVIRIAIGAGFCGTSLLVNNSVTFDKLGSVNGLALMMTSAFRFVSPLFAGSIYSASLASDTNESIGFPLDYHLIFIIFGFIFLITLFIVNSLPKSINHQKILQDSHINDTGQRV